ncbi:MBG domain-containing protein [Pedobacter nutrimenti]|uniref:MBG domain-containing protein n=1 Tax=Pedobacter nutrimenti TaxID=1241337 RepID=UPI00292E9700|nr:MBG domain-containing protein [Pedobacter nutrimenti]
MKQSSSLRLILTTFLFIVLCSLRTFAQLSPGDIAIVGFNSDTEPDELALVTLASIPSGQVIKITDRAWTGSNAFDVSNTTAEGLLTWTTTSVIPAGTLLKLTIAAGGGTGGTLTSYGTVSHSGWTDFAVASGGDNWFIYTGTEAAPTFIYGFANWSTDLAGGGNWLSSGTPSATTSYKPSGLTSGTTAVALTGSTLHGDNTVYTGIISGTKAQILAAIGTTSSWQSSEDTPKNLNPGGTIFTQPNPSFTITTPGVALSTAPTLTFSNATGFGDHIAQDGDGGSVTITDLDLQTYPINSSAVLLAADPLQYHDSSQPSWTGYPPIITYGDINPNYGWTIKSTSGTNFSLESLNFMDWGDQTPGIVFKIEGFDGGVSKGSFTFPGNTSVAFIPLSQTSGNPSFKLPAFFKNIDEVRLSRADGAGAYIALNDIKVNTPSVALSNNADLNALVLSSGALNPVFAAGTLTYTASVPNSTASVTITPTVAESHATIKVNGTTVASGAASGAIALAAGSNTITTIVTAQDGSTAKTYTIIITKAAPTVIALTPITLTNPQIGVTYSTTLTSSGGTTPYTYTVMAGTLPTGLSLSSGGVLSGTPTASGAFNFTITSTDAVSFTGSQAYTVTILIPTIVLNPASLPNGSLNSAYSQAITASGGTAPYSYTISSGSLPPGINLLSGTLSGTPTTAGDYNFVVKATDASTGTGSPFSVSNSYSLTIAKLTQSITLATTASSIYGTSDFDPGATSTSLLPVTYSTSDPAVATVIAGKIHIVGKGTVTVYADQTGNSQYLAAPQVSQTLTITAKAITVTATAGQSKVYGAADPTFVYTITSGGPLLTGDAFTGTLGRTVGENIGTTYAINQGTLNAGNNYTVTFVPDNFAITAKPITVTATAGQSKVYGAVDPLFAYTITSGGPLKTGDTFTGALARAAGENIGAAYAINQGTLSAGSNYTITFVPNNFAITAKPITVTATAGQSKVYGAIEPILAYTITSGGPLKTGDSFMGTLERATGETVGTTYAINQGTLSAGSNYTITFIPDNFAITAKPITITATAGQSKVYGAADPTFAYTITSGGPLLTGDAFTGTLGRTVGENIGTTYAINQGTLSAGNNYTITFVPNNFAITAKAITVTATAGQSKVYGSADATLAYTITSGGPLQTGDTFTGTLARAAGENIGTTYAINQGTLSAGNNYTITFVPDNFAIIAKPITVTATAGQSKVYGAVDPLFAYTITSGGPLKTGDAFTGALARAAGENIGAAYAINQGTLSAGSNYTITFVPNNFAITAKTITVTATAGQSKVYGSTDPTFAYSITSGGPLQTGDSFTGTLERATGETVGTTYAINQGTLTAGSNYTITFVPNNFAITAKAITVTATAGQSKVYGTADPLFAYTITNGGPLKTGDAFTGTLARAAGENIGTTYAINQGTLSAGNNYTITFVPDNFAITAKAITVTATAGQSKVYGAADPTLAYTITSGGPLKTGDAFTGALARATGENIGTTYAINQGTLSAGNNYTITFVPDNFAITAKPITVTATAGQSKVYGAVDPLLAYSITNGGPLKTGDAFTGALARAAGENIGTTYAINQGTLSAGSNYTITFVPDIFAITAKPITVTATAGQSKVYGSADPLFTYTITSGGPLQSGDAFTGKLARTTGENVGTAYAINQGTLSAGNNYTITFVPNNFAITRAALVITADNKEKFAGTANPPLTASYQGFVNQETSAILTTAPMLSTTATTSSPIGDYPIKASGAAATNYSITYVDGTLKVKPGYPTSISLAAVTLYENRPAGTNAGTLSSTADDPLATFSYTLVSGAGDTDNALFAITGNQVKTTASLDYETKSSYSIRVRSTTQYGFSLDKVLQINISDVNEIPTLNNIANQTICYTTTSQNVKLTGISPGPESAQTTTLSVSSTNTALFESLNIVKNGSNAGTLTYKVKNGASGTATLTVTVKDSGGQANGGTDSYSTTFTITVNPLPVVAISSDQGKSISKGVTAQLTATGGTSYSWATASGILGGQNTAKLSVRPSVTTTYTVTATNASGCSTTESFTLEVRSDYQAVDATNILSPNGDGKNDLWVVRNIDLYPNNEVKVFDRAGRIVFGQKGYNNTWDGTYNGVPLQEGTYYYIIDFGTGQLKQKGFITVVRNN